MFYVMFKYKKTHKILILVLDNKFKEGPSL